MKRLLIIPPQLNPIPAVDGGAVESLLTSFINENELKNIFQIFVISKKDEKAQSFSYKNCKIYYVEQDKKKFSLFDSFLFLNYKIKCFFRKIFFNRITIKFLSGKLNGFKPLTYFGFVSSRIAKKIKPDIVLSEGNDKLYQFWKISEMIGPENCYYHLHFCRKPNLQERMLFNNSICVSKYVLNGWVGNDTSIGRNKVIYNGIDLQRFEKRINSDELRRLKNKYQISNDDFVIGFAARFRPGKGIVPLLKAFNLISSDSFKLLLMGDFVYYKEGEEDFKKEVNGLIKENKRVISVGKIDYEKIHLYYSLCNLQVICSTYEEASPLVAIEGMAEGLPLIITRTGGLPECLNEKCSIMLDVDTNLVANLANSFLKLYKDKELRKRMGDEGKVIASYFSKESYFDNLCSFLLGFNNE